MGTSSASTSSGGTSAAPSRASPNRAAPSGAAPSGASSSKGKNRHRNKRKAQTFEPRSDFKRIHYLDPADAARLDKFRGDLQESIERTVRIERAFQRTDEARRGLQPSQEHHRGSGRSASSCDIQRKFVSDGILHILKSKEEADKRRAEEAAKEAAAKKRKDHEDNCVSCYFVNSK